MRMSTLKIVLKEAFDVVEDLAPRAARAVAEKSVRLSTKTRQIQRQIEAKDAELAGSQRTPDRAPDHDAPEAVSPDGDAPTVVRNDGTRLVRGDDGYYYEPDGTRVPYSNPSRRPDYADGQVETVYSRDRAAQAEYLAQNGSLDPDESGFAPDSLASDQIWLLDADGNWQSVTWRTGDSRRPEINPTGAWDMGHLPGGEFRSEHRDYLLSGDKDTFLGNYRDPDLYKVEHPGRNRSHMDEA
jgi:hypothetical protein